MHEGFSAALPMLPVLVTFDGGLNWTVGFLTTVAIFGILALALNLQWGYTGVFNFGVVAFFMVGAYTSALLTLEPPGPFEDYLGGFGLPVPVGWLGGLLAGGLLALVIGLPTLRLRRDFLAIATIGRLALTHEATPDGAPARLLRVDSDGDTAWGR